MSADLNAAFGIATPHAPAVSPLHQPRTTFAGGRELWSTPSMPQASQKSSAGAARAAAAPPAVAAKRRTAGPLLDLTTLQIRVGVTPPAKRAVEGKYDAYFAKVLPKAMVECTPDVMGRVATAMRKYLSNTRKVNDFKVIARQFKEDGKLKAGVWMWPVGEPLDGKVPARASDRKGARA